MSRSCVTTVTLPLQLIENEGKSVKKALSTKVDAVSGATYTSKSLSVKGTSIFFSCIMLAKDITH